MTVQEIIGKALRAYPVEFRAALIKQAEMHDDYANLMRSKARPDQLALRGAENQRNACLSIYDTIGLIPYLIGGVEEATNMICGKLATCVVGLNAAAKILDIPAALRTAAIVKWEEEQTK